MMRFTWYWAMKEDLSLENMEEWVPQPEGWHKNRLCFWRSVVYNSSVRSNSYWLECSITLDMWVVLAWNCHIFFLSDTVSIKLYESLHLDLKIKLLYVYKLIRINKMVKNETIVFLFWREWLLFSESLWVSVIAVMFCVFLKWHPTFHCWNI